MNKEYVNSIVNHFEYKNNKMLQKAYYHTLIIH